MFPRPVIPSHTCDYSRFTCAKPDLWLKTICSVKGQVKGKSPHSSLRVPCKQGKHSCLGGSFHEQNTEKGPKAIVQVLLQHEDGKTDFPRFS